MAPLHHHFEKKGVHEVRITICYAFVTVIVGVVVVLLNILWCWRNMKVLILGSGLSGKSAGEFLKKQNIEVTFATDEEINDRNLSDVHLDRLLCGLSFIVISPGISMDNLIVKKAKKKKIAVVGELELGSKCFMSNIIAVTGTNGKTTTVSLIYFLLKDCLNQVYLGGNIGIPVTSFASEFCAGDVAVLECSSFQLESVRKFHAHIAVVLNITEDHLNRHKTMKKYISCKQKIASNQTEKDFLLLNADSELLMQNIPKTKAKILFFSTQKKVVGCYVKHGCIYFNDGLTEKKLVTIGGIKLLGEHNLSNILAGVLCVYLQTNSLEPLKEISKFHGVEHRIEYVKTIKGVSFFNDSKATNIDSTLVALKSFDCGINLILGGSDKGYSFDELFAKMPKNVKNIAIFGQTKHKIANSAEKYKFKNIYFCSGLKESVRRCFDVSEKTDVVLLSPACASFDCFSNFEERGQIFKKIVKEISLHENSLVESSKKT